jgi:hypothetical protein
MRGLVEVGLAAALLSAVCGCIGDEAQHDFPMDAGWDADVDVDAGFFPAPERPPIQRPVERDPTPSRSAVPDALVGAWQAGSIDFALWEAYKEGYYAGRDALPSREAMIFREDGSAKFYRYEFAYNFYEELIDCEGTVTFHADGRFTFVPEQGLKRFINFRYSEKNTDRALTAEELVSPELAGTRAYSYDPASDPDAILIKVPSSSPYHWYRKK